MVIIPTINEHFWVTPLWYNQCDLETFVFASHFHIRNQFRRRFQNLIFLAFIIQIFCFRLVHKVLIDESCSWCHFFQWLTKWLSKLCHLFFLPLTKKMLSKWSRKNFTRICIFSLHHDLTTFFMHNVEKWPEKL